MTDEAAYLVKEPKHHVDDLLLELARDGLRTTERQRATLKVFVRLGIDVHLVGTEGSLDGAPQSMRVRLHLPGTRPGALPPIAVIGFDGGLE